MQMTGDAVKNATMLAVRFPMAGKMPCMCVGCGRNTSRRQLFVETLADEASELPGCLGAFSTMLLYMVFGATKVSERKIRVKVPVCDECAHRRAVTPWKVESQEGTMLFLCHERFRKHLPRQAGGS
jgi:hypothetical protein